MPRWPTADSAEPVDRARLLQRDAAHDAPKLLNEALLLTTLSPTSHAAMLVTLLDGLPPELKAWRDPTDVDRVWAETLREQIERIDDLGFAAGFARGIGLAAPRDYLNRVVRVDGSLVLAGIRFLGGDRTRPFVDLLGWTDAALSLDRAADEAMKAYDVFRPTAARVFRRGVEPPSLAPGWTLRMDQVVAAERVARLATAASEGAELAVDLEDADLDEAEAFVRVGYEAFAKRHPELVGRVPPAARAELTECRDDGRLAWWRARAARSGSISARAGLIAAKRADWMGLDGLLMVEELACPVHRVPGSASRAQQRLAEWFAARHPAGTLFGTIDADNAASRRAAARAGRREIASWWFLSPVVRDGSLTA